ncbi:uncharacterized protein BO87DRAFT_12300 [Aspergillus neoniger CBS 115656]|uniref:Uncharacterized protein n=1 Tax=Aspergillus neoniger (strain CBS 115656) TaxID=1448310 RepID=A0A318ZIP2_ASPNB|nr:hypothetical protein BO87DRAFT_12300 [Aspergillus neoniger CBS 115656]PYH35902.1 hypothetical protein BO87DRAFT_12300 [Aspergillus neoniger CBS 115656]
MIESEFENDTINSRFAWLLISTTDSVVYFRRLNVDQGRRRRRALLLPERECVGVFERHHCY